MPLTISVVIPTYNRLPYLREAIASVLRQSRAADEILIIDDGSSDGTEAVVGAMPAPVRYIRQKNAGPAAARNRGMREAKSEWIAFLDSDDLWLPDRLELQEDFLRKNPDTDFIFGNQVNLKDGVTETTPEVLHHGVYQTLQQTANAVPDFFSLLLQTNPVPTSSVIFRRSCLEQVGYFEEHRWRCEDYDLWLRFARHCRVGFIDRPLVAKRSQEDNLINDYMKLWSAHLDVLRSLPAKHAPLKLESSPRWKSAVAHSIYRLATFELSWGRTAEAKKWFDQLSYSDLLLLPESKPVAFIKKVMVDVGCGGLAKTQRPPAAVSKSV